MRTRHLLFGFIVIFGVLTVAVFAAFKAAQPGAAFSASQGAVASATGATPIAESKRYRLDPVHSTIIFRIEHMGVAPFYGRFNEMNGHMNWNREDPEKSSMAITIKAQSVDTNNERRDNHLRSPDFFTVREHPEITFRSTSFALKDSDTYSVTGDLTLHGVTKQKTIELHRTGARTHPQSGRELVGFETAFTIKRSDHNMNWGIENGALGDEVKIMVGIEGIAE